MTSARGLKTPTPSSNTSIILSKSITLSTARGRGFESVYQLHTARAVSFMTISFGSGSDVRSHTYRVSSIGRAAIFQQDAGSKPALGSSRLFGGGVLLSFSFFFGGRFGSPASIFTRLVQWKNDHFHDRGWFNSNIWFQPPLLVWRLIIIETSDPGRVLQLPAPHLSSSLN